MLAAHVLEMSVALHKQRREMSHALFDVALAAFLVRSRRPAARGLRRTKKKSGQNPLSWR
jgi:hypothetical protein